MTVATMGDASATLAHALPHPADTTWFRVQHLRREHYRELRSINHMSWISPGDEALAGEQFVAPLCNRRPSQARKRLIETMKTFPVPLKVALDLC
jgi:hypothetical protein